MWKLAHFLYYACYKDTFWTANFIWGDVSGAVIIRLLLNIHLCTNARKRPKILPLSANLNRSNIELGLQLVLIEVGYLTYRYLITHITHLWSRLIKLSFFLCSLGALTVKLLRCVGLIWTKFLGCAKELLPVLVLRFLHMGVCIFFSGLAPWSQTISLRFVWLVITCCAIFTIIVTHCKLLHCFLDSEILLYIII